MADENNRRAITFPIDVGLDVALQEDEGDIAAAFERYSEEVKRMLSTEEIREIMEANGQHSSGSDAAVLRRCQDLLFYGPLEKCPVCEGNNLEFTGYYCECTATNCIYRSKYPPRKQGPINFPMSIANPDFDPNAPLRERVTLSISRDGLEINGHKMNMRTISKFLVVAAICFFVYNLLSKLSIE